LPSRVSSAPRVRAELGAMFCILQHPALIT
jgi:hypothetical protein